MEKTVILDTTYGKIRGVQREGNQVFKGVRYAKAERFQKPVRCVSDQEIYDATSFPKVAHQLGQPEGSFYDREFWHHKEYSGEHSEDCLFLNIFKPDHAENLPVAVWIHGGAFMNGFCSKVEIDGEYWNREDVILVSITYRLGILGFLTCGMLDEAYGDSGNLAIYDQLAAIDWVHEHIASFGGNPDHITIMGQSAGAMSVQTLLCSPLLNKGVVGAVMQSGGGIRNWMNRSTGKEEMRGWHEECLKQMGITTLEQLLAYDPQKLTEESAAVASEKMGPGLLFYPHMSEEILPDTYENMAELGKMANVPYIIGCTKNDMTVGESLWESPIYTGCTALVDGVQKNGFAPDYVYVFGKDPLGGEGQGSFHSSDLWYSFHTLYRSWREKDEMDYQVADEMCLRWATFVKTGNPNCENLPEWPAYSGKQEEVYKFGF